MIRDERPGVAASGGLFEYCPEAADEIGPVDVVSEDDPPLDPPADHVMERTCGINPGLSWHTSIVNGRSSRRRTGGMAKGAPPSRRGYKSERASRETDQRRPLPYFSLANLAAQCKNVDRSQDELGTGDRCAY
jgi:hypothetical protein